MEEIKKKSILSLKLANYFVETKKYKPIVVRNSINDVWFENFHEKYKIIRIVIQPIKNDVQLETDLNFAYRVKKNIEKNTFSLNTQMLNIYVNCEANIHNHYKNIEAIIVNSNQDLNNKAFSYYDDISSKVDLESFDENEQKRLTDQIQINANMEFSKIRRLLESRKTPIVTYLLIAINFLAFGLMYIKGNGSEDIFTLVYYGALAKYLVVDNGEYFRLFTSAFLHIGYMHFIFNNYALFLLGKTTENLVGPVKFTIIYFMSVLLGSLLSIVFLPEALHAGASAGIYGILGALIYFGYNNRSVFGGLLRNNLVPVLLINLAISFILPRVNAIGHIGGLIGGVITIMALGTLNADKNIRIHGILATLILYSGLIYMIFLK